MVLVQELAHPLSMTLTHLAVSTILQPYSLPLFHIAVTAIFTPNKPLPFGNKKFRLYLHNIMHESRCLKLQPGHDQFFRITCLEERWPLRNARDR